MCFKRIILTNLNQGTVRKELKIEKNGHHNCKYNGTPLVRPPIFHQKSGLSRGVASHQGRNQYIYVYIYSQVAFPEGVASRQGGLSKGVPL